MTLPIPPSDSFYKFTAIGGLILVILSVYIPQQKLSEYKVATYDTNIELQKLIIETEHWTKDAQRYNDRAERTKQNFIALSQDLIALSKEITKPSSKAAFQSLLKKYQENVDNWTQMESSIRQMESSKKQLDVFNAQTETALEKKTWLLSQFDILFGIAMGTFIFGLIMSAFGFYNWYYKFQVYQDRIIKAQSERMSTPSLEREHEEIPG
jgi:hypothetical protein